ncbi:hypothetical protein H4Q26_010359 [Puccinia striiformis f. sp. tritici PST-130]|nr:hypothetical protein H4Q26_010359 [Puccinia striiformis f. sp. tritici PST-130]
MNSPVRPPPMNWAHRTHDLCKPAFNLLTQELVPGDHEPMLAEHVICLLMSLALDDGLADVGSSMGGMQSVVAAYLEPERVGQVVSNNTPFGAQDTLVCSGELS